MPNYRSASAASIRQPVHFIISLFVCQLFFDCFLIFFKKLFRGFSTAIDRHSGEPFGNRFERPKSCSVIYDACLLNHIWKEMSNIFRHFFKKSFIFFARFSKTLILSVFFAFFIRLKHPKRIKIDYLRKKLFR